jgi:hypothetical protein
MYWSGAEAAFLALDPDLQDNDPDGLGARLSATRGRPESCSSYRRSFGLPETDDGSRPGQITDQLNLTRERSATLLPPGTGVSADLTTGRIGL